MSKETFQREVLASLDRIERALGISKPCKVTPRVVPPPGDTIPPTNPNEPPGTPGPIEPPPIDRTA